MAFLHGTSGWVWNPFHTWLGPLLGLWVLTKAGFEAQTTQTALPRLVWLQFTPAVWIALRSNWGREALVQEKEGG